MPTFKKLHTKKEKKPRFERGRRACSENPPTRTDSIKLSFDKSGSGETGENGGGANGEDEADKAENEALTRLLDDKLRESGEVDKQEEMPPIIAHLNQRNKSQQLMMARCDSIAEILEDN